MPTPAPSARPVCLVGFMATGKTTVGRLVAEALRLPFIDLDERIEADARMSVRDIFGAEGEAGFRRRERQALGDALASPAVIATGGGAPCDPDNLAAMRRAGLVVALTAPLEVVRERVTDASSRPLLDDEPDAVRALFDRRQVWYRQAHACVPTEDRTPNEVARQVAALVEGADAIDDGDLADATVVALGDRAYPVLVAAGGLATLGAACRRGLPARCRAVALISDETVAPLYAGAARASLEAAGLRVITFTVPAGERAKHLSHYGRLCEELVAAGLDRSSAVVALGGGVVGDLAGFVAATLFRGVALVQVPTTILAMVDSAIGGKTGVNIEAGKNLVGAFWQPSLVCADPEVLATLPARERRAAFGELVKYALLDGEQLYDAVDALAPYAAAGEGVPTPAGLTEVVRRCAAFKGWIVTRDEREQRGERALLNLGHTVGHAIEAATGYDALLHGEAVALGLVAACRLSAALGLCGADLEARVAATLRGAGLDADIDPWLTTEVLGRIGVDKKRTGSRIGFVTVAAPGVPGVTDLELAEVSRILRRRAAP